MKYFVSILLVTTILSISSPPQTFAHELKENDYVIVVLHINPNDNPIVGEKAGIKFLITEPRESFPSIDCDCTGIVLDKGVELVRQKLFVHGELSDSIPYTFSHSGIYQVRITGTPNYKDPDSFRSFSITFNLSVKDSTAVTRIYSHHTIYIVLGIFLLVVGIVIYTRKRYIETYGRKNV